jgi:CDP-diacylglycerol--serine O-phosphatidyltransferase
MAFLLVSTVPTFSGKLMGERIAGDYVLPMFVAAAAAVALLITYPYGTLTLVTLLYLGTIPVSYRRFERRFFAPVVEPASPPDTSPSPDAPRLPDMPVGPTKH